MLIVHQSLVLSTYLSLKHEQIVAERRHSHFGRSCGGSVALYFVFHLGGTDHVVKENFRFYFLAIQEWFPLIGGLACATGPNRVCRVNHAVCVSRGIVS